MTSEQNPTVTKRQESIATMTQLISMFNGLEKWAKIEIPYTKDDVTEMILPTHYLADKAGPMAKLMIDNFLSADQSDEDYPEQRDTMEEILAGYMGLAKGKDGEWVRVDADQSGA